MFRDEVSGTGMQAPSKEAAQNEISKGVPTTCSNKDGIENKLYGQIEEV